MGETATSVSGPLRTFANARRGNVPVTIGRQHASGSRPTQANLTCFASLAVPGDLASSQQSEGVFMTCRKGANAAVIAQIGTRADARTKGVGEVLV